MRTTRRLHNLLIGAALALSTGTASTAQAAALPDSPLFLGAEVPPLLMLTLARNHKLYYEAYDDASDINRDDRLDTTYKPDDIDYFGYFDSFKCYAYDDGSARFEPIYETTDKTCGANSGPWSGDFLNYLTTSRMDALRKVLYGGRRIVETDDTTVLERAYIPQDAHSWGKSYRGISEEGYDIREFTPLSLPAGGSQRHLFASTNLLSNTDEPLLRVLTNRPEPIWEWLSTERPVANDQIGGNDGSDHNVNPDDYVVRVEVCQDGLLEDNCKGYESSGGDTIYRPSGLLHEYGETGQMRFGLLTGSYENNMSGGVLRRAVSDFADEVNENTGAFKSGVDGIVNTIDRLRTINFGGNFQYDCGFIFDRPMNEGECNMWGNPIAEMVYETLRYFSGKSSSTDKFDYGNNAADDQLGLNQITSWSDPYSSGGAPECAKPFQLAISDINPSYDSDYLPGADAEFQESGFSGDSSFNGETLDVKDEAQTIWNNEPDSSPVFIGQSGSTYDGAPTPKTVAGFGSMRGLAPEEPTKQGSYYSASVSYFAKRNDINPATGDQTMDTFAVALASPLPRIRIPTGNGTVTLVPFGKSVAGGAGGSSVSSAQGDFQPTNTIVDFYVDQIANVPGGVSDPSTNGGRAYGRFRINYEDAESGADHDMDAIVVYEFKVLASGKVKITLDSTYAAGSVIQHMGYVISGTQSDGTYLEVRDADTNPGNDADYFLDTPDTNAPLPLNASREFTAAAGQSAAFVNQDPLWYAAKYGGFKDGNSNTVPDQPSEWDEDGDGDPDNYFFVSNAGQLGEQLTDAFDEVLARVGSASTVSINSTRLNSGSVAYQATFNSETWEGDLKALNFNNGTLNAGSPKWSARKELPAEADRNIWTRVDGTNSEFDWGELSNAQQSTLSTTGLGEDEIDWIRGDRSNEKPSGTLRQRRDERLLGDIVDSAPQFVGGDNLRFDGLSTSLGGDDYNSYLSNTKTTRDGVVFVGANDGMLHAFDAEDGDELFAYVPEAIHPGLPALPEPSYGHQYYVNGSVDSGDAYIDLSGNGTKNWQNLLVGAFAHGNKGIYALNVTDPSTFDSQNPALWEITEQTLDDAGKGDAADDIGHVLGDPQIALTEDDKWVAIFGNGYNSTDGDSALFMIDLADGSLEKVIRTNSNGGGLGTPFLYDADGNRKVDAAYAGDLEGNLWKFDLEDETVATTDPHGDATPLFVARGRDGDRQPITTRPTVGPEPENAGGQMVYFGTGRYDFVGDSNVGSDPQIQSVYGLHDEFDGDQVSAGNPSATPRYGNLVHQSVTDTYNQDLNNDGTLEELRQYSDNDVDYHASNGWVLDLKVKNEPATGERVIARPTLRFDRLILNTFTPKTNPCEFGGESWLIEVNAVNGSRFHDPVYDLNDDGQIDQNDLPTDGGNPVLVSGVKIAATTNPPAIISGGKGNGPGGGGSGGGVTCIEQKIFSTVEGDQQSVAESCDALDIGRQSWHQIR